MLWLVLVLFVALVVAVVRGGRLTNLADVRLNRWWLLPLGFLMQAATGLFPREASWAPGAATATILASYLILLVLVVANRNRTGLWLCGLGVLMNFSVIALNAGMPVLSEAAAVASGVDDSAVLALNIKHVSLDAGTRLPFLADVIPLRLANNGQVISLGDVFLAVGLAVFLEYELRRPVRWFRHGVKTEGGSATRQS